MKVINHYLCKINSFIIMKNIFHSYFYRVSFIEVFSHVYYLEMLSKKALCKHENVNKCSC